MAKRKPTKVEKEEERKSKTELFKRLFLNPEDSNERKAREFADLVAGNYKRNRQDHEQDLPRFASPVDEMRDLMRDPFGTKDWAASREIKKAPKPEVVDFVLAEPSEEELQAFYASQPPDDE